jgi:hypothetical protein
MRVITEDVANMRNVRVAYYKNTVDLARECDRSVAAQGYHKRNTNTKWAGGSYAAFQEKSVKGDVQYARRAEKLVDKFANLAIKDYARVLDYNLISGQLDYQAAMSGDPLCMYGQTIEETDTAPVHIYVDAWTSWNVSPRAMEMRGVAVLALTLALSMHRPVLTKVVTGLKHRPSGVNSIQVIDVPTTPMDLSMASWMMASPMFFRHGIMSMAHGLAEDKRECGLPTLDNMGWQKNGMAKWLAAREGVREVVFLPLMMGDRVWEDEAYVEAWVKGKIAKFTS